MEMLRQESLNLNPSLGNRGQRKVSRETLQVYASHHLKVSALPHRILIRFLRPFCFERFFSGGWNSVIHFASNSVYPLQV